MNVTVNGLLVLFITNAIVSRKHLQVNITYNIIITILSYKQCLF